MTIFHFVAIALFNSIVGGFSRKITIGFYILLSTFAIYQLSLPWFITNQSTSGGGSTTYTLDLVGASFSLNGSARLRGDGSVDRFNGFNNRIEFVTDIPEDGTYTFTVVHRNNNNANVRYRIYQDSTLVHSELVPSVRNEFLTYSFDVPLVTGNGSTVQIETNRRADRLSNLSLYRDGVVSPPVSGDFTITNYFIALILSSVFMWVGVYIKDLVSVFR